MCFDDILYKLDWSILNLLVPTLLSFHLGVISKGLLAETLYYGETKGLVRLVPSECSNVTSLHDIMLDFSTRCNS